MNERPLTHAQKVKLEDDLIDRINELESKLAELRAQQAALVARHGAEYVGVDDLQDEIDVVQGELEDAQAAKSYIWSPYEVL